MAEIYPLGENRIFYRTSTVPPPDKIEVDLLDPELNNDRIELTSVVDSKGLDISGLYYFEANFSKEGTYIAIFYENGSDIPRASQAFSTRRIPAEGEFKYKGLNVIG